MAEKMDMAFRIALIIGATILLFYSGDKQPAVCKLKLDGFCIVAD